jgi:two-component system cell cycle sensor histidine kinase PleC
MMAGADVTLSDDPILQGLDALRIGIAIFDADDKLTYCNQHYRYVYRSFAEVGALPGRGFEEILRLLLSNGEIAGREVLEDAEGWIARRVARHRKGDLEPVVERLADGRWFEIKERPTPGGGVIGLWQDITAQKRDYLRLNNALESAADGLVLWDQSGRLLLCNELFRELHGDGPVPRPGDRFAEVIRRFAERALDSSELAVDYLVEAWVEQHARPVGSHVVRHRDGRWLLVRQRRGRDGGAVTVLSDISELKNREQELILRGQSLEETISELEMVQHKLETQAADAAGLAEQLDLAKREIERSNLSKTGFLRIISHELRTPLHAIIGFAELLRDQRLGPIGNPLYAEYAGDIRSSGDHLLSLVNQLLDLSRVEAGRYQLSLEQRDIAEVVAEAARIVEGQVEAAGLSLTRRLADDLPALPIDEQAIRQVLVNLLSNAIKFTPAGGEVRVEAGCRDGWLVLTVGDSGIGISAEMLPRLMRPFERIDNALNRQTEGTGLGLAISKAFVELHGGRLEIDSDFGAGTTVTMRLPLTAAGRETFAAKAAS